MQRSDWAESINNYAPISDYIRGALGRRVPGGLGVYYLSRKLSDKDFSSSASSAHVFRPGAAHLDSQQTKWSHVESLSISPLFFSEEQKFLDAQVTCFPAGRGGKIVKPPKSLRLPCAIGDKHARMLDDESLYGPSVRVVVQWQRCAIITRVVKPWQFLQDMATLENGYHYKKHIWRESSSVKHSASHGYLWLAKTNVNELHFLPLNKYEA